MTFLELFDQVKQAVWPEGIARNLLFRTKHQLQVILGDMQYVVPMLQSGQSTVYDQGATFWRCGTTFVPLLPLIIVNKVEVFVTDDPCCVKAAFPLDRMSMECKVNSCGRTLLVPTTLPDADGFYVPDPNLDLGYSPCDYYTSIIDDMLWLWPNLSSTRSVRVTWTGIKRTWVDIDVLPDTWILGTALDPDIYDFVFWSLQSLKDQCDETKLAVAEARLANRRAAMMTDPARQEARKLQLKQPCIPCSPYTL